MSILQSLVDIISAKPVLTRKDLQRMFGKSENTIDRWHANGTLPPGKYLPGCRSPFWSAAAILAQLRKSPKLQAAKSNVENFKR